MIYGTVIVFGKGLSWYYEVILRLTLGASIFARMVFVRLLCQPLSLVSTLAVRKDGLVNEGPHKRGNIIAEAIDRIYK